MLLAWVLQGSSLPPRSAPPLLLVVVVLFSLLVSLAIWSKLLLLPRLQLSLLSNEGVGLSGFGGSFQLWDCMPGARLQARRGELHRGQGSAPGTCISYPLPPDKPPQNMLCQYDSGVLLLLTQRRGRVQLGTYSAPCGVSLGRS